MENGKRIELHKQICDTLHDTYLRKNANYGNSFVNTRNEVKNAIIVRLMDKMERLKTLFKGDEDLVGESIDDTLLDLANYAILELIEREIDKNSSKRKFRLDYTQCFNNGNIIDEYETFDNLIDLNEQLHVLSLDDNFEICGISISEIFE